MISEPPSSSFSSTPPPPPEYAAPRDPGTPQAAIFAWLLGILLVGVIVIVNQAVPKPSSAATQASNSSVQFTIFAKIVVKLGAAGLGLDEKSKAALLENIDKAAATPLDRVKGALAASEIAGPDAGLKRLDELGGNAQVSDEVRTAAALSRKAIQGGSAALAPEERARLVDTLGWFGRLAVSKGLPDSDPERAALISGGAAIMSFFLVALVVAVLAFFAALACGITAIVLLSTGRIRPAFVPPSPGGSVYLEMIPVFAGLFLCLKVGMPLLISAFGTNPPSWATTLALLTQWSLVVVIFYPLLRGVPWARARRDLGWHSGRGVFREIGAGLFGYFAGLPIVFAALVCTFVIVVLRNSIKAAAGQPIEEPENPVLDIVLHAKGIEIFLFFTLATIWAPLVEETLFRGAFYRHLRSRIVILLAAAVSAVAFGIMHGYEYVLLLPVMSLGFVFALIREWRGSLIGPMIAHGLHNATLMTVLFLTLSLLKD